MTTTQAPGHIHVLVVEDEQVFVELVRLHLVAAADVNFDITVASSVHEGLSKFDHDKHDVILLDLHLPNGEGLSLVKLFLRLAGPDVPVVVTSKIDDPHGADEILKAGAAEFVGKVGFDSTKLVPLLKAVVARRRSLQRVKEATEEVTHTIKEVKETLDALKEIAPQLPVAVASGPVQLEE